MKIDRKREIGFFTLLWIVSAVLITLMVIAGGIRYIIKGTSLLSIEHLNKMGEWIMMSQVRYFLLGIFVVFPLAIFIGSVLGIFSSRIIGKSLKVRVVNFISICITDILEALPKYPTILLGILIIPQYYEHRLLYVMAILGILNSSKISRIIKAKIDSLEKREYIEAAKSFGISKQRLILIHILKYNCLPLFITQSLLQMIDVLLIEIGYAYISSVTSWGIYSEPTFGNMLVFAKNNLDCPDQAKLWVPPLFFIILNILTFFNLIQIIEKKIIKKEEYGVEF